ncbi:MAG TPA: hypothetical protein VGL26_01020 [Jatrophihabitans sp.]|jgi:hypothetical protein
MEGDVTERGDSFKLNEDEGLAVAEAATAFASVVGGDRAALYRELAAQAVEGSIDDTLIDVLERVSALALETGKSRQIGKAEAERYLLAVYRRTPAGAALTAEVSDINKVLAHFAGKPLESIRVSARMPGRYLLDIAAEGFAVQLSLEPEGLEVRSVNAG